MAEIPTIAGVEPKRATVTNRQTGERKKLQFNPTTLNTRFSANYSSHTVPGASRVFRQYINTENPMIPLVFFADEVRRITDMRIGTQSGSQNQLDLRNQTENTRRAIVSIARRSNRGGIATTNGITDFERFLMAFVYPTKITRRFGKPKQFRPPIMKFLWPKVMDVSGIVHTLNFAHQKFSTDTGESLAFTATLELEVLSRRQITSEDVRDKGMLLIDFASE